MARPARALSVSTDPQTTAPRRRRSLISSVSLTLTSKAISLAPRRSPWTRSKASRRGQAKVCGILHNSTRRPFVVSATYGGELTWPGDHRSSGESVVQGWRVSFPPVMGVVLPHSHLATIEQGAGCPGQVRRVQSSGESVVSWWRVSLSPVVGVVLPDGLCLSSPPCLSLKLCLSQARLTFSTNFERDPLNQRSRSRWRKKEAPRMRCTARSGAGPYPGIRSGQCF